MSFTRSLPSIVRLHPEMKLGGYSAYDGTIEFYGRVKGLVKSQMCVLDFGAGRGAWYEEEDSPIRRDVRLLKGHVSEVIGCDLDAAVLDNKAVDRSVLLRPDEPWPFDASSIDLIIADYVLEHLADPGAFASEITRILKPGGWLCARTPTRYNYVSVLARVVRNVDHARVLRRVQPGRKDVDVFPTLFRLNTHSAVRKAFRPEQFEDCSYLYSFEPQYHFGSAAMYRLLRIAHRFLPTALHANLFVFLRKRN